MVLFQKINWHLQEFNSLSLSLSYTRIHLYTPASVCACLRLVRYDIRQYIILP